MATGVSPWHGALRGSVYLGFGGSLLAAALTPTSQHQFRQDCMEAWDGTVSSFKKPRAHSKLPQETQAGW